MIERHRLPGYAVGVGSKGCVTFSPQKIVDYETFKANQDVAVTELAWLWNMNRGIYMTPGREEEWTLSVTHTDEAIDDYVARVRRDGRRAHGVSRPAARAHGSSSSAVHDLAPGFDFAGFEFHDVAFLLFGRAARAMRTEAPS